MDWVLQRQEDFIAIPFFVLCPISLVISSYYSIPNITVSLRALELESSVSLHGQG